MANVIYDGDDFKRMLRKDMQKQKKLVDAKKTGIFEVDNKEGKIKVEIKKGWRYGNRKAVAGNMRD